MSEPTPERRFTALALADPGAVQRLAERVLEQAEVEVLEGPLVSTMLVELTESVQGQPFYVGEVVVSGATVTVAGVRGDSLVVGRDPQRALAAAVCDAAAGSGVLAEDVQRLVARTEREAAAARRAQSAEVAATRVSFEVIG